MVINNAKNHEIGLILELNPIFDCAQVVAEMELARGADSGEDFHTKVKNSEKKRIYARLSVRRRICV